MKRTILKSKIHRGSITDADLSYEGSLTLDPELMHAADIQPYEQVQVVNINNGARFETYAIEGLPGSKTICLNGAAARLGQVGDRVIVMSYAQMDDRELEHYSPRIVLLKEDNSIVSVTSEAVTA